MVCQNGDAFPFPFSYIVRLIAFSSFRLFVFSCSFVFVPYLVMQLNLHLLNLGPAIPCLASSFMTSSGHGILSS